MSNYISAYTGAQVDEAVGNALGGSVGVLTTDNLLHIQDQKPTATFGGTSVVGLQKRELNTILVDNILGASLLSNNITLPIGTYYIEASAPAANTQRSRISLKNETDVTTELLGTTVYPVNTINNQGTSFLSGLITLSGTKALSIQHYIQVALATYGLGFSASDGDISIFAEIKIWKVG